MAFSWEFGASVETIFKSDLLSIGKIVVVSNNNSVVGRGGGRIVVVSANGGITVVGIIVDGINVVGTGGGTVVGAGGGNTATVVGGNGGRIVTGAGGGGGTVVGTATVVKGRVKRDGPVVANGATGIGFCLKLKSKKFPLFGIAGSGAPFVFNPNALAKCWKNKLIVLFGRSSLGEAVTLNTISNNTVNTLIFILSYIFLFYYSLNVLIPGLFKSNWFRTVAV